MFNFRRRVDEKLEENGKLDCLFKHEEVSKKTWLEISLKPGKVCLGLK